MTIRSDEAEDKDDVLYAFSVEPKRDVTTLEKYLKNYPQYRDELVSLSIELLSISVQDEIPTDIGVSKVVTQAWEKFQSMLLATDPLSKSASAENPLSVMDNQSFRELAKNLDLSRTFLTRLRDQTIIFSSIPTRFVKFVADAVNVSVDTMVAALDRPATVSSAQSFKADEKPAASKPISFDEAITMSNLSEQQQTALKTFKD